MLAAKRPLAHALFDLLREGFATDTPETRAAFRNRLDAAAARIGDKGLANEYRSALRDRLFATTRRRGAGAATQAARASRPARGADTRAGDGRAEDRALLAILLNHPGLIGDVAEALSGLPLDPAGMPGCGRR